MLIFLSLVLGLIFGSFLTALSYRLPRGVSIAKGRSICPNCKKKIAWYDNIPVISYIILGGRCRNCKKRISLRYPLIEALSAAGFYYIILQFNGNFLRMLYYLFVFCVLVLIFVIDLEHQIIPDVLIFSGLIVSLAYFLLFPDASTLFNRILAGFLSAAALLFINIATKGKGMGLGDVKFAVLGGILTGLNLFLVWLFASFLTGGIAGIILILGKRAGLKDHVAFGPFLVVGMLFTFLYGKHFLAFLGI